MFDKREFKFDAVTGMLRTPHVPVGLRAKRGSGHVLAACGVLVALLLLALAGVGCNNGFKPVEWSELGPRSNKPPKSLYKIVPRKNMNVANLAPDDIVRIMQRVGFADQQILDLGTDLHNALRFSGAAEVFYKKRKLAIYVVDGDYVRIQSPSGRFDYEIPNGRFLSPLMDGG